jgi:hypothetical protein
LVLALLGVAVTLAALGLITVLGVEGAAQNTAASETTVALVVERAAAAALALALAYQVKGIMVEQVLLAEPVEVEALER